MKAVVRDAHEPSGVQLARYGALQFALSFVALPLYVFLPAYYGAEYRVPLGLLGALLLGTRLADALVDPALGRLADRMLARRRAWGLIAAASLVSLAGFAVLMRLPAWLPYAAGGAGFTTAFAAALWLAQAGGTAATVAHQAWGAALGQGEAARTRVFAWRESLGLAGVLAAAAATQLGGASVFTLGFALSLGAALALLRGVELPRLFAPRAGAFAGVPGGLRAVVEPLRHRAFRGLLATYVTSGVAASIPATLVLFFVRDRIEAPQWAGAYLLLYFAAAAAGVPLWLHGVRRFGAAPTWLLGIALTVCSFAWAAALRPGQSAAYAALCAACGLALGSDLIVPPALLAGLIRSLGHGGRLEGAYFGLWNLAAKFTLALAAGVALPLLGALGYRPGSPAQGALPPLVVAYALLPCALKILSGWMLWRGWMRPTARDPGFLLDSTRRKA